MPIYYTARLNMLHATFYMDTVARLVIAVQTMTHLYIKKITQNPIILLLFYKQQVKQSVHCFQQYVISFFFLVYKFCLLH